MKRFLLTAVTVAFSIVALAQADPLPPKEERPGNMKIENVLSDLSSTQKTRIDVVTRRSEKIINEYRKELRQVRDSIRTLMDSRDDNSDKLFPLIERESALKAEISKEYYRAKVEIDKVLTPEQYLKLHENMEKNRPRRHMDRPPRPSKEPNVRQRIPKKQ